MFLLALMWPVYTITGFDASAHTSEETVQASRNVPRGILRSVLVSGTAGWIMVASFVLAMPDLREAARQGANVFPWLMAQVFPGVRGKLLWIGIVARELPVRAGEHHLDLAHDLRVRARRRPAVVVGAAAACRRATRRRSPRSGSPPR